MGEPYISKTLVCESCGTLRPWYQMHCRCDPTVDTYVTVVNFPASPEEVGE